ncbi:SDR family oxidoreductase [Streptomyces sp. NPDC048584]|uniref:SDR family oxidoreductase n=1 Tax=Streptomyces sp. NPDC048584 TaxID=3365573 RepID=UPI0037204612
MAGHEADGRDAPAGVGGSVTPTRGVTATPCIAPGITPTEMIHEREGAPGVIERLTSRVPMERAAEPEEAAQAAAWPLRDRASYVGDVLRADGGMRGTAPVRSSEPAPSPGRAQRASRTGAGAGDRAGEEGEAAVRSGERAHLLFTGADHRCTDPDRRRAAPASASCTASRGSRPAAP